eukprot:366080-Chlamydomonas_euryale.AAC.15
MESVKGRSVCVGGKDGSGAGGSCLSLCAVGPGVHPLGRRGDSNGGSVRLRGSRRKGARLRGLPGRGGCKAEGAARGEVPGRGGCEAEEAVRLRGLPGRGGCQRRGARPRGLSGKQGARWCCLRRLATACDGLRRFELLAEGSKPLRSKTPVWKQRAAVTVYVRRLQCQCACGGCSASAHAPVAVPVRVRRLQCQCACSGCSAHARARTTWP